MSNKQNNNHSTQIIMSSSPQTNIEQLNNTRPHKSQVYAIGANISHGQRLFCISPIKE